MGLSAAPYFKAVQFWDDHRNIESFFFFFLVALGVSFPALIAWWRCGTHHGHVSYSNWLKGLVSGETFQLSHAF